jgi:hypothetical protein
VTRRPTLAELRRRVCEAAVRESEARAVWFAQKPGKRLGGKEWSDAMRERDEASDALAARVRERKR